MPLLGFWFFHLFYELVDENIFARNLVVKWCSSMSRRVVGNTLSRAVKKERKQEIINPLHISWNPFSTSQRSRFPLNNMSNTNGENNLHIPITLPITATQEHVHHTRHKPIWPSGHSITETEKLFRKFILWQWITNWTVIQEKLTPTTELKLDHGNECGYTFNWGCRSRWN